MLKKIRKNLPEALAFLCLQMPRFIYGAKSFKEIPVFCFHSSAPLLFERQLKFLQENKYRTLTADEYLQRVLDSSYRNTQREIVISFDDGMASVWTVAFPLLRQFGQKAILFVLPGLTPEGVEVGTSIESASSDEELARCISRDYSDHPLCNWREIESMHESGVIDIQSHGMDHALINVSPEVVDFVSPDFDPYHYENIHIPIYRDEGGADSRSFVLGHPVYKNSPRLAGKPRYMDDVRTRRACEQHVLENGGRAFFSKSDWRGELLAVVANSRKAIPVQNSYETPMEFRDAIHRELYESKVLLETRLRKQVRHFCFPWYADSSIARQMAADVGYQGLWLGYWALGANAPGAELVTRLQEEFLFCLPGRGGYGLRGVSQYKAGKDVIYRENGIPRGMWENAAHN